MIKWSLGLNKNHYWLTIINLRLLTILILVALGVAQPASPATAQEPEDIETQALDWECIRLTNKLRATHNLPPLKAEPILIGTARAHSQDMAARGYVAHTTPEGIKLLNRLQAAGYHPTGYYSENIFAGWQATPEIAIQWWYDEEPPDDWHRRNLLSVNLREFGCGVYLDSDSTYSYFTQDFGQRPGVFPVIINREAVSTTRETVSLYLYGQSWGATEMMFSENANFEKASWQPFDPISTWTLSPGPGQKTIYAQIRNASGEVRGPVFDSILAMTQPYHGYLPLILKPFDS